MLQAASERHVGRWGWGQNGESSLSERRGITNISLSPSSAVKTFPFFLSGIFINSNRSSYRFLFFTQSFDFIIFLTTFLSLWTLLCGFLKKFSPQNYVLFCCMRMWPRIAPALDYQSTNSFFSPRMTLHDKCWRLHWPDIRRKLLCNIKGCNLLQFFNLLHDVARWTAILTLCWI